MLLSAEWFMPHWELAGMLLLPNRKSYAVKTSRKIVKAFMQDATEYCKADLSEQRKLQTYKLFFSTLQADTISLSTSDLSIMHSGARQFYGKHPTCIASNILFMQAMQEVLAQGSTILAIDPCLAPTFHKALQNAFEANAALDKQLQAIEITAKNSSHPWDEYLRSLTPQEPDMRYQKFKESIATTRLSNAIWMQLRYELPRPQLKTLSAALVNKVKQGIEPGFNLQIPMWMT